MRASLLLIVLGALGCRSIVDDKLKEKPTTTVPTVDASEPAPDAGPGPGVQCDFASNGDECDTDGQRATLEYCLDRNCIRSRDCMRDDLCANPLWPEETCYRWQSCRRLVGARVPGLCVGGAPVPGMCMQPDRTPGMCVEGRCQRPMMPPPMPPPMR